jgi:hypothetical protein
MEGGLEPLSFARARLVDRELRQAEFNGVLMGAPTSGGQHGCESNAALTKGCMARIRTFCPPGIFMLHCPFRQSHLSRQTGKVKVKLPCRGKSKNRNVRILVPVKMSSIRT